MRPRHQGTPGPSARQYKVVGGPGQVMYCGAKTRLLHGRILSDASCDIALMRAQGVLLAEIIEAAAPAAEPPVEAE